MSNENENIEEYIEITEQELEQIIAQASQNADITNAERVDNTLFDNRIIYLSGVVDEDMAYSLIPMIHYYNSLDDSYEVPLEERKPIHLYVDSEGGSLYKGLSLTSAIKNSKTPVWTYLEGGIGMSAGMLLFLSGDVKHMSKFAHLMYHELIYSTEMTTLSEAQNLIRHYENIQDKLDEFFVENSSIPLERLKEQRSKNLDWYIDFDTAKKYKMFDVEI